MTKARKFAWPIIVWMLLFLAAGVLYYFIFVYISYIIANFVGAFLFMKVAGVPGWKTPLMYTVIITVFLWACFDFWLGVPFPTPIWG